VIRGVKRVWVLPLSALLLAACGGGQHRGTTVGVYGPYPAQTITGSRSAADCARDARIFARDSLLFLAHSAGAAYPADLYYVILREDFTDFAARLCDPALLGPALRARLTAKQRATLVADLPTGMATAIRNAG
jgi:hypothetical protein